MKSLGAIILAIATGGVVSSAVVTNLTLDSVSASGSQTVDYTYTGQLDTFTVPNGVFSISVSLSGAEGGALVNINNSGNPGKGGYVSATIDVSPGDVFKVKVGQQGQGFTIGVAHDIPMAGGWPNGGDGYISPQSGIGYGAGGGGATSLFKVVNNSDTLIATAGGGGGAGGQTNGGGGGTTGGDTFSVAVPFDISREATGGSQSAGGQGACVDETGDSVSDFCSGNGSSGQGGDAGVGTYGGAGGGGGYFGGGSGIGNGGGAGGSTWWDSSVVTATNNQTGVRSGNGIASITYTPLAPCTPGTYSATGYVPCVNASLGYFVNVSGATSQTPCPTGYTTSATASISCNPIPTTSTSSTTVAPTPPTTTPLVVSVAPVCAGKVGQTLNRTCLVKNLKVSVPSTSKVVPKISKSSAKICKVSGTSVKTLKKGTCSLTLTVTPKKGKAKAYSVKVVVS